MKAARLALVAALLLGGVTTGALAEATPEFTALVTNLGYEITPATSEYRASFLAGGYTVSYDVSLDKTVAILSIGYDVSEAQSQKVPAGDMLRANGVLTSTFQVKGTAARVNSVALSRYFLAAGLTPVGLRQQVDALIANANEYSNLLNPDNWK